MTALENTLLPRSQAAAINALAGFCGPRDLAELSREALREAFGWDRADVVMFFGGSILSGAQTMAAAMQAEVAETAVLVGGEGHTTESLRSQAATELGGSQLPRSEAEIFDEYLRDRFGVAADLLECESTNCGNNITNAVRLLQQRGIRHDRVILIQDATMQRRMDAVIRAQHPGIDVVNFASYTARVEAVGDEVRYASAPPDMWPLPRFTTMLLGEIERLRDDENGYGPRGRGWIAHVDIPADVAAAYEVLVAGAGLTARQADPRWG